MSNAFPKILVVDDEQHQLDTICRGLFLYGYEFKGVLNAKAALAALDSKGGDSFDLMLTDLTMPDYSGIDLVNQVRMSFPSLPIVVITGLTATIEVEIVKAMGIPLLRKPFDPDALDEILRQTLEMKT